MRVGGSFLDGWRPTLNELLVLRDGEAVRQMDREDRSVEQGAANILLCFFCSVIFPRQGAGEVSGIPLWDGGLSSFSALPGGAVRLCPPTSWRWQQG